MNLNLHQLSLFYTVARLGSFSRAAAELRISQPAVSAQVREFEQRYELDLFHRVPRGVTLTDTGLVVLGHAEKIFDHAERLQSVLRDLSRMHGETMTIGGSLTAGECFLPIISAIFRDQRPGIQVNLRLDNSATILHRIACGEIDFGFVGAGSFNAGFTSIRCWEDEIVIIARPSPVATGRRPVAMHHLESQPFVMREAGSATQRHVEACLQKNALNVQTAMIVGSPAAVKRHVAAGIGWGFASKLSVVAEVAAGHLVIIPVNGWDCRRTFHAVHLDGYRLSPLQQDFIMISQRMPIPQEMLPRHVDIRVDGLLRNQREVETCPGVGATGDRNGDGIRYPE